MMAGATERTRGTGFGELALAGALAGTVAWSARPGTLAAPAWWAGLAAGGAMMLAAAAMIRWLRHISRSRRLHFCYRCGYDLRGNASGVCPECGTTTHDGIRRQKSQRAAELARAVAAAEADDVNFVNVEGDGDDDDGGGGDTAELAEVLTPPSLADGAADLPDAPADVASLRTDAATQPPFRPLNG